MRTFFTFFLRDVLARGPRRIGGRLAFVRPAERVLGASAAAAERVDDRVMGITN
jgi:hypothetical protein